MPLLGPNTTGQIESLLKASVSHQATSPVAFQPSISIEEAVAAASSLLALPSNSLNGMLIALGRCLSLNCRRLRTYSITGGFAPSTARANSSGVITGADLFSEHAVNLGLKDVEFKYCFSDRAS
jgi:hypothetical protein